ncbi:Oxygen sensor protein DosP [Marinomonas spartinae]|uniref:EAL domain-containing protein n=1 Tax=Marinomonas spartinae TaxID=1792290 RepID=UPI000808C618|nr:EAL domain-containing protein [Marinomonas spartinae]SBS27339.1 Oxygen sensor protein DosP [Marinomonas spartinae]
MKKDDSNVELNSSELQESNDSLIVLDSNDLIVSYNDKAKKLLLLPHLSVDKPTLLECFWFELDMRVFHLSEFKRFTGKTIKLMLVSSGSDAYHVSASVEAFHLLGERYFSLRIKEDSDELGRGRGVSSYLMAKALNADLQKDLLELYYQPQINTLDGRLYGLEVLIRWNSREFGQIAPDEFVALAENFGFIAELDLWVLRNACQQLAMWRKQKIDIPRLAVNFSPISFDYLNVRDIIRFVLSDNGISSSSLVIELTENKKIQTMDAFVNTIRAIHLMGVGISLDDFGVGYSNLKRLLKFPVSQLKLDRVFVTGLPGKISKDLSESILSISHKIGAVSIAEGVETQEQFDCLKRMGYEVIQGYFFCPPLSKMKLERWLKQ